MYNRAIVAGRVGRDPEIRQLKSGEKVASFTLASTEFWRDKATGERKEMTEWHNIVCFNPAVVQTVENFVRKGMLVLVEGQIQTRKWQDQDGKDRYTTEIVIQRYGGELRILSWPDDGDGGQRSGRTGGGPSRADRGRKQQSGGGDGRDPALDDDIPF